MIGFSVAAYIYRIQGADIDMLISTPVGLTFKLVVGKKGVGAGLDTDYVDKALKKAGLQFTKNFDNATPDEMVGFAELAKLET
jgi:hypothetical protein